MKRHRNISFFTVDYVGVHGFSSVTFSSKLVNVAWIICYGFFNNANHNTIKINNIYKNIQNLIVYGYLQNFQLFVTLKIK